MWHHLSFIVVLALLLGGNVRAEERIAIAVGYSDAPDSFWQKAGVAPYPYYPAIAETTVKMLTKFLVDQGFVPITLTTGNSSDIEGFITRFRSASGDLQVDLIDSNEACPEASPVAGHPLRKEIRSPFGCTQQKLKSRAVAEYVRSQLFKYDALIYIGHARYGSGLGFGDFNDEEAKVNLHQQALNLEGMPSSLKIAGIISCNSMQHYSAAFDTLLKSQRPRFVGVQAERVTWFPPVIVQHAIELLRGIISQGGVEAFASGLPPKFSY